MPCRIFFAGAEGNDAFHLLNKHKVRFRLVSFYYLRKKSVTKRDEIMRGTTPEDVAYFVDSGAYTVAVNSEKLKQEPAVWLKWVEEYVDDYAAFLEKYRDRIFVAVELDADSTLETYEMQQNMGQYQKGVDEYLEDWKIRGKLSGRFGFSPPPIEEWNKRLTASGVPILRCWHPNREWAGWLDTVSKHKYVGIGSGSFPVNKWFPYINEARKTGSLVHGFALTKPEYMRRFPLASADSTTWMDGSRFGHTAVFQNGRLRHFVNTVAPKERERFKRLYTEWGVDMKALESGRGRVLDEINLVGWLQFAEYVQRAPSRDYWKTEFNGAPLGSLGAVRGAGVPEAFPQGLPPDEEAGLNKEDLESEFNEREKDANPPLSKGGELIVIGGNTPGEITALEKNPLRVLSSISSEQAVLLPVRCNDCTIQDRCPFKQESSDCYFRAENPLANLGDFADAARMAIGIQIQRVTHGRQIEKADGGVIDRQLSFEVARLMDMLQQFRELVIPPQETVKIEARGQGAVSAILASLVQPARRKKPAAQPGG